VAGGCSAPQKQQRESPPTSGKQTSAAPQDHNSRPVLNQAYPEARFEVASKAIRSVPIDAFPELPDAFASVLRERGCKVPQASTTGTPRNVIHGDFFVQGQTTWAALCLSGGFSSILVFRDNLDAHPEELARSEDKNYLEDFGSSELIYLREITTVDQGIIMGHYRAYGGPEPPPIDHQGIDDSFLEKASITYYWYKGKWLKLQGAD
jgi:hypothetical protein